MARAKNKIENRLDTRRKNFCIQETKKSYTQQHALSIQVKAQTCHEADRRRLMQATQTKNSGFHKIEAAIGF
jgi:hypothetical protein